jgi:hypothetical protein
MPVDITEKMPAQELADNEQGSVSYFIQFSHLNCTCRKKLPLTIVFWQGFRGPDGINYVAKTALI